MDVIRVGPFMLDFQLLLFIFGSLAAYLAIRLYIRHFGLEAGLADPYTQALLLGFGIWKLSPVLFDPAAVIAYPLSLLYFDGGFIGGLLGGAVGIIWLLLRTRKTPLGINDHLALIGWGWLAYSSLRAIVLLATGSDAPLPLAGQLLCNIGLALFIWLYMRHRTTARLPNSHCWQWYSLIMIALGFLDSQRLQVLPSLSKQQIVFVLLFVLTLCASWVSNRRVSRSSGGESDA